MIKSNAERFFELNREFDRNHAKFNWWNGAEFGTIIGGMVMTFVNPLCYWILFAVFCVEFGFALHYQKCEDKILKEMEKLIQQDKQNV